MATEIIDGVEHTFAPNAVMRGSDWSAEYPPINANVKWLRNRYTGEIVPNFPEFAGRSDVFEPYLGDPYADGSEPEAEAPAAVADGQLAQL